MSELLERKKAFYRTLVVHGINHPHHLKSALPLGSDVPQEKLESWLCKFTRVKPMEFPETVRNVNRFKLGADPEFVFATPNAIDNPDGEGRGDAFRLGLKQGLAFGADNNGRLAEIRPFPSRSALETCASVMATLKWMAIACPRTMQYHWRSGAFIFRDGIGGHVHFGRKRPNRDIEVRALDVLSEMMNSLDIYPRNEIAHRRRGDARGQRYGMPGDFRLQNHGYEYRTFPSWLDSPELAFLTLTLSKLTVQDPTLLLQLNPQVSPDRKWQQLLNFLAFYKGVDDDARMSLLMLQRNVVPRHTGGDFKARWGISAEGVAQIRPPQYIPPAIAPSEADKKALFNLIVNGRPLTWQAPEPTWKPTTLPDGYVPVISYVETTGMKGLGELLCRMCVKKDHEIHFHGSRELGHAVYIGRSLANSLRRDWQRKLNNSLFMLSGDSYSIGLPQTVREGPLARQVKDALLSGVFPIWHVEKVQEDSWDKWQESVKTGPEEKKVKMRGKVVMDEVMVPPKVDEEPIDEPFDPEEFS